MIFFYLSRSKAKTSSPIKENRLASGSFKDSLYSGLYSNPYLNPYSLDFHFAAMQAPPPSVTAKPVVTGTRQAPKTVNFSSVKVGEVFLGVLGGSYMRIHDGLNKYNVVNLGTGYLTHFSDDLKCIPVQSASITLKE